jgi:uncharacterized protein YjiS (DUF1127 family)
MTMSGLDDNAQALVERARPGFWRYAATLPQRIGEHFRTRRATRQLDDLSEHLLKDIGVKREGNRYVAIAYPLRGPYRR